MGQPTRIPPAIAEIAEEGEMTPRQRRHSLIEMARRRVQHSDPAGYSVIALPYLVLLKLAANRGRDIGDLTTILGWASESDLAQVYQVVARYSPEDVGDLESLIFIGQKEREFPPEDSVT
ncbi:MAG: hypothetical protein L0332_19935 [Chloroflexi bacterium]|nr:hypothetical protein [Chloroflexota bacterium]MCI0575479.1 hypothetical protein [Chloroflexota bacterium]MCI0649996.1 hypothetical protein [Chloroflexota bacterium]MCI0728969.1 hypothetical protein [Chloroflexota bacterium]